MGSAAVEVPPGSHVVVPLRDILVFAAFFLTLRWFIFKRKDAPSDTSEFRHLPLPPSPPGLPLFGNLFSLRTNMRPLLQKWAQELGGIFNIRVGPNMNMIVISDIGMMQEAFIEKSERFSDRSIFPLVDIAFGRKDSIFLDNEKWRKLRRFGHQALRSFGVGKTSMENRIKGECEELISVFRNHEGSPFNPQFAISNVVANVTCSIVAGRRYEYTDPVFQGFIENLNTYTANFAITSLGSAFPQLYYTPVYKNFYLATRRMESLMKSFVGYHQRELEMGVEVQDFVDFIRLQMVRRKERGQTYMIDEGREWRVILDFFIAGISTTSDTLYWALLLMAKHPDILSECQKEIDEVIGTRRTPTMADKDNMPFVSATIQEIMRYRPVVPLGVPHESNGETILGGYRIPEHSIVIMNIWELHMSPNYWDEPEKFNPRRFLSKDGKTVLKPAAWVPFGMGLRVCLGEKLAKMSSFLIFTHILQKFTFRLAEESESIDMDGMYSVILMANEYKIIVKERQEN